MAEELNITKKDKRGRYEELLPQVKGLITGEENLVANLSNIAAALRQGMDFFWVGFYLVDRERDELVLGPFQGPVACTRIGRGKGVCGSAWDKGEIIIVPDVDEFPGHIACSSQSKSEIVIPVFSGDDVFMILDVDSDDVNAFDEIDAEYLEKIVKMI